MNSHPPFFSVVIATRNREALLAETLGALASQRWPGDQFEVLVADNGSTDGTRAVVERAAIRASPAVRYRYVDQPGKSSAVNAVLGGVRGNLVAMTDDDVCPEPDWLERLAAAFAETGADFVAGRILPRWECDPPSWLSSPLYGVLAIPDNGDMRLTLGPDGNGRNVIPIGANMAVKTSVIRRVGGLRQDLGKLSGTLRTGEDHEFYLRMLRAGCHGVYEPTARVRHFVPRERLEASYFCRWHYQNGRDVSRLESAYATAVRRLFGVPRYLWRQAATDIVATLGGFFIADERQRFATFARLIWFGGYVRDAWWGRST
jgi:cellulose synthase/poly-beta-1,6-N-acetylglucosamine synthase-like glycosyltransferase